MQDPRYHNHSPGLARRAAARFSRLAQRPDAAGYRAGTRRVAQRPGGAIERAAAPAASDRRWCSRPSCLPTSSTCMRTSCIRPRRSPVMRRCCAGSPGAARRTPRTSGRCPNGRSARSSPRARGRRPARRPMPTPARARRAGVAIDLVYHGIDTSRFPPPARPRAPRRRQRSARPVDASSPSGAPVDKKGFDDLLARARAAARRDALAPRSRRRRPAAAELEAWPRRSASPTASAGSARRRSRGARRVSRRGHLRACRAASASDGDRDGLPNVLLEAQSQRARLHFDARVGDSRADRRRRDRTARRAARRRRARGRAARASSRIRRCAVRWPMPAIERTTARFRCNAAPTTWRGVSPPASRAHENRVLRAAQGPRTIRCRPATGKSRARCCRRLHAGGHDAAVASRLRSFEGAAIAGGRRDCAGSARGSRRVSSRAGGAMTGRRRVVHVSPPSQGAGPARARRQPSARHSLRRRRSLDRAPPARRTMGRRSRGCAGGASRGR